MTDLNTVLRDQARSGLQAKLGEAVTNGDTEAALKITTDLEKLAVSTAPKAPPYGEAEIRAELDKQPWFGVDPRKSAKVVELGKMMDLKKFPTAAAYADALLKAVDEEFKPTIEPKEDEEEEGEEEESKEEKKPVTAKRRTDAPREGDTGTARRSNSGPWTKLADAPADIQKEINRSADRFVPSNAKKEQRDGFVKRALETHYTQYQRNKGKK